MIGILRRCRRCAELLSIDQFRDVDPEQPARVCYGCMNSNSSFYGRTGGGSRTYALTDKARAALKELAAA